MCGVNEYALMSVLSSNTTNITTQTADARTKLVPAMVFFIGFGGNEAIFRNLTIAAPFVYSKPV